MLVPMTVAPALKTFTLARRGEGVDHDRLVEHWRGVHAPGVVEHMRPDGYTLTFFDPRGGRTPYDGMAELRFADSARGRSVTGAATPAPVAGDGWLDRVAQPLPWLRVAEHVVVAGPSGAPATAGERAGAFKLTFLLSAAEGVDLDDLRRHWLDIHVPNYASNFVASGGVRYVVNIAEQTANTDLVGLAEISYRSRDAAESHVVADDGFRSMIVLRALPGREEVIVG